MQGLWRSAGSAVENLAWRRPGRQLVDDAPTFSRWGLRVVAVGYCAPNSRAVNAVTTTTCEAHWHHGLTTIWDHAGELHPLEKPALPGQD